MEEGRFGHIFLGFFMNCLGWEHSDTIPSVVLNKLEFLLPLLF